MNIRRFMVPVLALVLVAVAFTAMPRADEGFWPYNAIPKAAIKAQYKFDVTDAWLKHLQLATVRFGGGTGSIVSPNGLVLTNHHIGLGTLQRLSTPEKDLVKNGFYAPTYADELKVPGMTLNVLQTMEDVTAKVQRARSRAGMSAGRRGRRPPEGHPGDPGHAGHRHAEAGGVALRRRDVPPLHLQDLHRRPPRVRRRVPGRVLRRRPRQLHVPALQPRRVDVPAVRERQAGRHAELPQVVGQRLEGRRTGLHDRPSGRDAALEHRGAPRSTCATWRCPSRWPASSCAKPRRRSSWR